MLTHRTGGRKHRKLTPVVALLAALGGTLLLSGCGDDDEATTKASDTRGVTEYVGAVSSADTGADSDQARAGQWFVALAVNDSTVEAYACDSVSDSELFSGELEGDSVELESATGNATLTATRDGDTFAGDLTVNGETQPFDASAAEGIGGLYTLTPDGNTVRGESERGNRLRAIYDVATYDYLGKITTADGSEELIEGDFREPDSKQGGYDEYRNVLLDSGVSRGKPTTTARPAGNFGWVDPDIDP